MRGVELLGCASVRWICGIVNDGPNDVSQVTLHAHTAREEGHISALICTLDPKTGATAKAKPR